MRKKKILILLILSLFICLVILCIDYITNQDDKIDARRLLSIVAFVLIAKLSREVMLEYFDKFKNTAAKASIILILIELITIIFLGRVYDNLDILSTFFIATAIPVGIFDSRDRRNN